MNKIVFTILLLTLTGCSQPSVSVVEEIGADIPVINKYDTAEFESLKLKTPVDKILKNKTIRDLRCDENEDNCIDMGEIKRYQYVTDTKITPSKNEVKRTKNSVVEKIGDEFVGRFFTGDIFHKNTNGEWYITKYATTTVEAYEEQVPRILGASGDPIDVTYDGYLQEYENGTWSATRNSATCDAADNTGNSMVAGGYYNGNYSLTKSYVYFDTSSVGAGSTITSAVLSLFVHAIYDSDNDGDDFIALTKATVATKGAVVAADCDAFEDTLFSTAVDIGTIVDDQVNDFTLNATGIAEIDQEGFSDFMIREGHDINDNAYNVSVYTEVRFRTEDFDGTATCGTPSCTTPYLTVTWTVPSTGPASSTQIILGDIIIK